MFSYYWHHELHWSDREMNKDGYLMQSFTTWFFPPSFPLRSSGIGIHRQRLDEARFERQFLPANKTTLVNRLKKMVIPPEPVFSALKPPLNKKEWRQFVLVHLPILSWVWSYRPAYLFGDIIAGITVAIMHIPQGVWCTLFSRKWY